MTPGSAKQRTVLSWLRTALSLLANGGLLLLRDRVHGGTRLPLAALALLLAAGTVLVGRRRTRTFARTPLPSPVAATREVYALGAGVAVLASAVGWTTLR